MYSCTLLYRIIVLLALSSCVHNNRLWAPPLAYNPTLVDSKLFENYSLLNPLNRYLRSLGTLPPRSRTPGHQTLLVD